jgi:hypothetical protein
MLHASSIFVAILKTMERHALPGVTSFLFRTGTIATYQWVLLNIKCDSSENGTCRFCRAIYTDLKQPKERASKFKKSYADKIEKAVSEFNSLFKIFMTKEKILVIKTKSQMLSILGILPNGLLLNEFGNNLTKIETINDSLSHLPRKQLEKLTCNLCLYVSSQLTVFT